MIRPGLWGFPWVHGVFPKAKLQDVAIHRQVGIGVVVEHRPESLGKLQENLRVSGIGF